MRKQKKFLKKEGEEIGWYVKITTDRSRRRGGRRVEILYGELGELKDEMSRDLNEGNPEKEIVLFRIPFGKQIGSVGAPEEVLSEEDREDLEELMKDYPNLLNQLFHLGFAAGGREMHYVERRGGHNLSYVLEKASLAVDYKELVDLCGKHRSPYKVSVEALEMGYDSIVADSVRWLKVLEKDYIEEYHSLLKKKLKGIYTPSKEEESEKIERERKRKRGKEVEEDYWWLREYGRKKIEGKKEED
jgi:hypothetical protein